MNGSNKNQGSPRNKKSGLTPEDEALWNKIKKTVEPLSKQKNRETSPATEFETKADNPVDRRNNGSGKVAGDKAGTRPKTSGKKGGDKKSNDKKAPPPLAKPDQKQLRRIRSGRQDIEARLDLHGMKQDQAYGALKGFLLQAQASGFKTVLVITGKGRTTTRDDGVILSPDPGAPRGVLRRLVPQWLAEPEMRRIVISYASAASHHGGAGALYLTLRKSN